MEKEKLKIIFMGTPEFGAIILEGLIKKEYKPVLVITSPDKPIGRKQVLTPSLVKVFAQKYGISVIQPLKIKDAKNKIEKLNPDLIILAAYGKIIPKEILDIPKHGSLNIHPSLLPRWRGPSPVQYTILNGDKETGVTIMKMAEKVDSGSILAQKEIKLEGNETDDTLHDKLGKLGADLLVETIAKWLKGEIKEKTQDESKATYTKILKKEDGRINWQKSAKEIERQIRAFYPWPGTFALAENKIIKILKGRILKTLDSTTYPVGKTLVAPQNHLCVQTGEGFLVIERLQLEGKKEMNSEDFLRGHPDFIGTVLK